MGYVFALAQGRRQRDLTGAAVHCAAGDRFRVPPIEIGR